MNEIVAFQNKSGIHPTAIIEPGAQIDPSATVGAYAYIGSLVTIGKGTIVYHHATVDGFTQMGENNQVFPYAFVGGKTHDLKYKGGEPGLKIGNNNVFREYATIHTATKAEEFTVIGDHCIILAYGHIAHDCQVGNRLVMSSQSALGGHVIVQDHVSIGWNVGVHQFCRLGSYCMLGGCSKIVQDVLPFMLVDGNPAEVRTINKVGLERAGYTRENIESVRFIYQALYRRGLNRSQAFEELKQRVEDHKPFITKVLEFVEGGTRGLV